MKNPILFPLLIILCISKLTSAQTTFQKTFGGAGADEGYFVQQTTDGGYIIAGYTEDAAFVDKGYLIKTNANGDTLWTKIISGMLSDESNAVQQSNDGGYIIMGQISGLASNADVSLIKTDSNGDLLWTKTYGGPVDDIGNSVQQTLDSGYIIAGTTFSFGAGSTDVYLIKTDANGDTLWTKVFGGTDPDVGNSVQQTSDGGFIIVGSTYSFGVGEGDVYLIRTDGNGDLLWTKTFGGTEEERGVSVQQTAEGGFIITGITESFGAGSFDAYLIKTDGIGDLVWSKTYGAAYVDIGNSVQQTLDGGYILAGTTSAFYNDTNDIYLLKTDSNGTLLWSKTFGGAIYNDWGYSVQQTLDGGYIIAGMTYGFGAGSSDVYLIKTDASGNSGCNQGNITTITGTPATQQTSPSPTVSSGGTVAIPTMIVSSGGVVATLCTSVGINEFATYDSFNISPNPSTGNFIIDFEGAMEEGHVEIFNTLGECIFYQNIFNESKKEINLKNIPGGVYFVKMFDGGKYSCKKIIIGQH